MTTGDARPSPVFMSTVGRMWEHYLPGDSFDVSLLCNTLFQPGMVAVDAGFFTAQRPGDHVLKSVRKSLLEACIESGIMRPAFRGDASTFQEALGLCRHGGVQGIRLRADEVARRLQRAADKCPAFTAVQWQTEGLGRRFLEIWQRHAIRSELPATFSGAERIHDRLKIIWECTKKWRIDCIYEAQRHAERWDGAAELVTTSEIMNAVGRTLGLPADYHSEDIREILQASNAPGEREGLEAFFRWVCECHSYVGASSLGCTLNFPGYNPEYSLIATQTIPSTPSVSVSNVPTIVARVPFPPPAVLLDVEPDDLLKIRENLGWGYWVALEYWMLHPTSRTEQNVRESLREYANEVVKWTRNRTGSRAPGSLELLLGPAAKGRQLLLAGLFLLLGAGLAERVLAFFSFGHGVFALYKWWATAPIERAIVVESPVSKSTAKTELNLPEPVSD
ncbi:MAG: hypothetical protein HY660_10795 [Armatimonadetes bacterium]|nr:hypothetical protein [Armatimonadota bacterium]